MKSKKKQNNKIETESLTITTVHNIKEHSFIELNEEEIKEIEKIEEDFIQTSIDDNLSPVAIHQYNLIAKTPFRQYKKGDFIPIEDHEIILSSDEKNCVIKILAQ